MMARIAPGLAPILTGIFQGISNATAPNYDAVQNVADYANHAKTDADHAAGKGEGTQYVTGQSGTQYQLPNMGYGTQWVRGQANAALHYMLTGNATEAVQYAAQKEDDAHAIDYRARVEAPKYDALGYNPIDIQAFVKSGNPADLTRNLGNRAEMINGKLQMLTGAQAQARDNAAQDQANADRNYELRKQELAQQQTQYDRSQANVEYNRSAVAGYDAAGHPINDHGKRLDIDTSGTGTDDANDAAYSDNAPTPAETPAAHKAGDVWKDENGQYKTMTQKGAGFVTEAATPSQVKAYDAAHPDASQHQEAIDALDSQINLVHDIVNSPGFSGAYGAINARFPTLSQDTANTEAKRDQLASQTFLNARQQLKGQGAISDTESKKAEGAATTLTNPKISEEAAQEAAQTMTNTLTIAKFRLQTGNKALKMPPDGVPVAPAEAYQHLLENPDSRQDFIDHFGYDPL